MGLDIYLKDGIFVGDDDQDDINSDKYPEHMFKKNYLRSSYNSSGFNSIMRDLVGMDLYSIFEPSEEYSIHYTHADLEDCLERAKEMLGAVKKVRPLKVVTVGYNPYADIDKYKEIGSKRAIDIVKEHLNQREGKTSPFGWYSNFEGDFFLGEEQLEVLAAIPGFEMGRPCVHLVTKLDMEWYIQACEIIIEFIEHALTLVEPTIHWSA